MRKSLRNDQSGYTMVLVLVAMLIVSLLSTAVISMASSNLKIGVEEREFQASYYIAEAGAVYYTDQIKKKVWDIYKDTAVTNESQFYAKVASELSSTLTLPLGLFDEEYGGQPEARVSFIQTSGDTNPRTYSLVSEGTNDDTTRIVQKEIILNYTTSGIPGDLLAVFSDGDMTFSNGTVVGPVGTNENIIIKGDPTIGDYHLYDTSPTADIDDRTDYWMDKPGVHGEKKPLGEKRTYALPPFPDFPEVIDCDDLSSEVQIKNWGPSYSSTLDLDSHDKAYVNSINLSSGDVFNINVGDSDKILMIDNFNLAQGTINVIGNGTLSIYIRSKFTIEGSTVFNPSLYNTIESKNAAAEKLSIYIGDSPNNQTIDLAKDIRLNGSIYAEKADLKIGGSGGLIGNIITGGDDVEIVGGSSATSNLIFAPKAKVSMNGSGLVKGAIISNEFYMDGGAKVIYEPDNIPSTPMIPVTLDNIIPMVGGTRER